MSNGTNIWNIVASHPKDVKGQDKKVHYVVGGDRQLPDLHAGFKVYNSDRGYAPPPSFLSNVGNSRMESFHNSVGPQHLSFLLDQDSVNFGNGGVLGLPLMHKIRVQSDGLPVQSMVDDLGARIISSRGIVDQWPFFVPSSGDGGYQGNSAAEDPREGQPAPGGSAQITEQPGRQRVGSQPFPGGAARPYTRPGRGGLKGGGNSDGNGGGDDYGAGGGGDDGHGRRMGAGYRLGYGEAKNERESKDDDDDDDEDWEMGEGEYEEKSAPGSRHHPGSRRQNAGPIPSANDEKSDPGSRRQAKIPTLSDEQLQGFINEFIRSSISAHDDYNVNTERLQEYRQEQADFFNAQVAKLSGTPDSRVKDDFIAFLNNYSRIAFNDLRNEAVLQDQLFVSASTLASTGSKHASAIIGVYDYMLQVASSVPDNSDFKGDEKELYLMAADVLGEQAVLNNPIATRQSFVVLLGFLNSIDPTRWRDFAEDFQRTDTIPRAAFGALVLLEASIRQIRGGGQITPQNSNAVGRRILLAEKRFREQRFLAKEKARNDELEKFYHDNVYLPTQLALQRQQAEEQARLEQAAPVTPVPQENPVPVQQDNPAPVPVPVPVQQDNLPPAVAPVNQENLPPVVVPVQQENLPPAQQENLPPVVAPAQQENLPPVVQENQPPAVIDIVAPIPTPLVIDPAVQVDILNNAISRVSEVIENDRGVLEEERKENADVVRNMVAVQGEQQLEVAAERVINPAESKDVGVPSEITSMIKAAYGEYSEFSSRYYSMLRLYRKLDYEKSNTMYDDMGSLLSFVENEFAKLRNVSKREVDRRKGTLKTYSRRLIQTAIDRETGKIMKRVEELVNAPELNLDEAEQDLERLIQITTRLEKEIDEEIADERKAYYMNTGFAVNDLKQQKKIIGNMRQRFTRGLNVVRQRDVIPIQPKAGIETFNESKDEAAVFTHFTSSGNDSELNRIGNTYIGLGMNRSIALVKLQEIDEKENHERAANTHQIEDSDMYGYEETNSRDSDVELGMMEEGGGVDEKRAENPSHIDDVDMYGYLETNNVSSDEPVVTRLVESKFEERAIPVSRAQEALTIPSRLLIESGQENETRAAAPSLYSDYIEEIAYGGHEGEDDDFRLVGVREGTKAESNYIPTWLEGLSSAILKEKSLTDEEQKMAIGEITKLITDNYGTEEYFPKPQKRLAFVMAAGKILNETYKIQSRGVNHYLEAPLLSGTTLDDYQRVVGGYDKKALTTKIGKKKKYGPLRPPKQEVRRKSVSNVKTGWMSGPKPLSVDEKRQQQNDERRARLARRSISDAKTHPELREILMEDYDEAREDSDKENIVPSLLGKRREPRDSGLLHDQTRNWVKIGRNGRRSL